MAKAFMTFKNKLVLAPMVRSGELPVRVECLKYGADGIWGPEMVDMALIGGKTAIKFYNEHLSTIDVLKPPRYSVLTRLIPQEKDKLIFQFGSSCPETAVEAAKIIIDDVAGIDLNCGCPKHFSIHAGMGAALLTNPDLLISILVALVEKVGKPYNKPISCKIRLLPDHNSTLNLIERICKTGISTLTVHCRTKNMKPREAPLYHRLDGISEICSKHKVQCIINGGMKSRKEAFEIMKTFGFDGAMLAHAVEKNPSVFRKDGPLPTFQVARDLLRACARYQYKFGTAKTLVARIVNSDPKNGVMSKKLAKAKDYPEMFEALEIPLTDDLKHFLECPSPAEQILSKSSPCNVKSLAKEKIVFVTVGSTKFDDLIGQVLDPSFLQVLIQENYSTLRVQYGNSENIFRSKLLQITGVDIEGFKYTNSIKEEMQNADLIITHGGSGSIWESLRLMKRVIVVPNQSLMDNHQMELADKLNQYCIVSSPNSLSTAIKQVDFSNSNLKPLPGSNSQKFYDMMFEEINYANQRRKRNSQVIKSLDTIS